MKKRYIAIVLMLVLVVSFLSPFSQKSYALGEPLTASIISGALYSMMSSWGISFTTSSATSLGAEGIFNNLVDDYCEYKGGNLSDIFYGTIAVDAAGKLAVSYQIYNTAIDFVDWMKNRFTGNGITLGEDSEGYIYAGTNTGDSEIPGGYTVYFSNMKTFDWGTGYDRVMYSKGSESHTIATGNSNYTYLDEWSYHSIDIQNNRILIMLHSVWRGDGSTRSYAPGAIPLGDTTLTNIMNWDNSTYIEPTVLNPDKEWTGTIGGQAIPDTNLDQLIGQIFEDVADNNLDVDGEVIDVPIPPPTPVPIDPDTPLSDVPWEGVDTNLQNLYNQGLEEIGAIGDAQDAITDAVSEQTGALEGAIADNAGVVSGAIDQAVSDIEDAISEQTQTLSESASATAEATESIAEALEDEAIDWQKFDLRGLFPFCIPFDIYNMLEALDASPTAPHVQLPFVIESIGFSYTIDLDFSDFDQVAAVMRTMELIVYGIALAWATSKVIKW